MASLRILIVDDDASIRAVLASLFEDEGYDVQVAADGRQALVAVAEDDFDVLLTDLAMPDLDGRGLLQTLRDQGSTIPIVLMSALPDLAETAQVMGVAASVAKPFDVALLVATIERIVQDARDAPADARDEGVG